MFAVLERFKGLYKYTQTFSNKSMKKESVLF